MQDIDFNEMIKEYLTQDEINALKGKIYKRQQERQIEEYRQEQEKQIKLYQEAANKGLLD